MAKIKVTQEVAKIIEEKVARFGRQMTLINHAHCYNDCGELQEESAWLGQFAILNEFSVETMALALYVGYEVEKEESQCH